MTQIYDTWSIDSLKIRIPLSKVTILDEGLNEMVLRVSESSGEVLESTQNTKVNRDYEGIKTTFSIEQRATKRIKKDFEVKDIGNEQRAPEFETIAYLIILINAKQLGSRYFEGITQGNFIRLFEYLMDLDVVGFTPYELLDAECTDIDIKRDFIATDEDMKEVLNKMHKNATPSSDYDKGSKLFWKKDNKGLQFNKRISTKHLTAPFIKIYSKTLDLNSKSNIFAMAHLENIPQNLWRLEYTIKNKSHLFRFDIGNTLSELFDVTQEQFEAINKASLKAVLEHQVRDLVKDISEIPPKDLLLVNSLIWHLDSGAYWSIIKANLLGSLKGNNKSKKTKYLEGLYEDYIRPIEGYSKHKNVDTILKQIGYTF